MNTLKKILSGLRALWSRNVFGKLLVGFVVVVACCILTFAFAALQPARPAQIRRTPMPGGSVFIAPTIPAKPSATPEPTSIPEPTEIPVPTPEPTATPSPDDAVKMAAQSVCAERFLSSEIGDGAEIVCAMKDEPIVGLVVIDVRKDFYKIVRAAWAAKPGLAYVKYQVVGKFSNKYGETIEMPAITLTMRDALFKKIVWDKLSEYQVIALITNKNPEESAIEVHPSLTKEWVDMVK